MENVIKPCTVVLERIDVSQYRNAAENNVTENNIPPDNEGFSEAMVEQVCEVSIENDSTEVAQCFSLEEDDEGDEIALSMFILFASSYLHSQNSTDENSGRKNRDVWVREWLTKRNTEGAYAKLLRELRYGDIGEKRLFRDFVRMSDELFDHLLGLVQPLIEKNNTTFRESIPAGERLALTLHYLATGNSFRSLQYLFRIPQPTISQIIPNVLDAIWTVLKDEYVRVSPDKR